MKGPERIRVYGCSAHRVVGIYQLDLEHTRQLVAMFVSTKKVTESTRLTLDINSVTLDNNKYSSNS